MLLLFLFCCGGGGGSVFVMVVEEVEVCLKEQKITRQCQLFFTIYISMSMYRSYMQMVYLLVGDHMGSFSCKRMPALLLRYCGSIANKEKLANDVVL